MGDDSIYESGHGNRQARLEGIAFGRITRVYEKEGFVEVKTFGGSGSKTDNHIPKCQWLNLDSSQDAKSSVIPQENTFCLVFFVGGEPYVYGFFDPLSIDGAQSLPETEEALRLTAGDRLLLSPAKNYLLVRANGINEFVSTAGNFIRMFPTGQGIIRDLLRIQNKNLEFYTSGGSMEWKEINRAKDTLFVSEHRDNIDRSNIIAEQKGKVGGNVLHETKYGESGTRYGQVPTPTKSVTVNNDGETVSHIRPAGEDSKGVKITSKPSGDHELQINDHTNVKIAADGKTTMDINNGQVTISIGSDGKIDIEAKSDVKMKNDGKFDIEASGKGVVKAEMIDLDGGGANLEPVHTFPSATSDFTGLPILTPSMTVKATT